MDSWKFVCMCAAAVALAGCAGTPPQLHNRSLDSLTTTSLRRFQSTEEFEAYRKRLRATAKAHGVWWAAAPVRRRYQQLLAQNDDPPCDPAIDECADAELSSVIMTASKRPAKPASITNNQEAEVDEGDIVKQYGRFLIVLQHGRLFSLDTGEHAGTLRLVDRIDVYSSAETGAWYDELLIHDNNLIVTGYNYEESASEVNVITIGADGALELQVRYFIESEDYYSGENYASRLVRGKFVVYTPLELTDVPAGETLPIPRMRRWTPTAGFSEWTPLFHIQDVYWPIQPTLTPALHVVSVCQIKPDRAFGCASRGVVGPAPREFYVSSENIYLWLSSDRHDWAYGSRWPDACPEGVDLHHYTAARSAVFQMPIDSNVVRAARTIGSPSDQFAFDERDDRFLALLVRTPEQCYLDETRPMMFASIPLSAFSARAFNVNADRYQRIPESTDWDLQSRYTENYLVYGSPQGYWRAYWGNQKAYEAGKLVVVPIAQPSQASILQSAHSIERIEVIGRHAVIVGVQGRSDLAVSTVALDSSPRIANTQLLPGLLETEGRSHAFNSLVDDDGQGLFGLPTFDLLKREQAGYGSLPSDVQFFAVKEQLLIAPLGELAGEQVQDDGYECEVSCVDWYGNARPIFIEDRIFALSGSQLVEGALTSGQIVEIGRLSLTGAPERR